ncbi:hypothetical protein C922_00159 [Plasmodium inui San Antonio 1]|uniref:Uncharacterized protein n=1 Tax=Plasmodium inui San Antonio 1 TaxID=1237626 RepID=W7AV58_9APIC|nr:hypothetical protein C922_00159 [Plasmodium inui San Antonio 1]EUD69296.1 hypothetical protein C922_00159 [Plasmodium inui San Antonio 1]
MNELNSAHLSSITFINSNGVIITTEIKEANKQIQGNIINDNEGNYAFCDKDLDHIKNLVLTLKPFHQEYEDNILFRIKKKEDRYRCEWVLLLKTVREDLIKQKNGSFIDINRKNDPGQLREEPGNIREESGHVCEEPEHVCEEPEHVCEEPEHVCEEPEHVCEEPEHVCEPKWVHQKEDQVEEKTFDCTDIKDIMVKYVYCITYFDDYIIRLRNKIGIEYNSDNDNFLSDLIKINNDLTRKKNRKCDEFVREDGHIEGDGKLIHHRDGNRRDAKVGLLNGAFGLTGSSIDGGNILSNENLSGNILSSDDKLQSCDHCDGVSNADMTPTISDNEGLELRQEICAKNGSAKNNAEKYNLRKVVNGNSDANSNVSTCISARANVFPSVNADRNADSNVDMNAELNVHSNAVSNAHWNAHSNVDSNTYASAYVSAETNVDVNANYDYNNEYTSLESPKMEDTPKGRDLQAAIKNCDEEEDDDEEEEERHLSFFKKHFYNKFGFEKSRKLKKKNKNTKSRTFAVQKENYNYSFEKVKDKIRELEEPISAVQGEGSLPADINIHDRGDPLERGDNHQRGDGPEKKQIDNSKSRNSHSNSDESGGGKDESGAPVMEREVSGDSAVTNVQSGAEESANILKKSNKGNNILVNVDNLRRELANFLKENEINEKKEEEAVTNRNSKERHHHVRHCNNNSVLHENVHMLNEISTDALLNIFSKQNCSAVKYDFLPQENSHTGIPSSDSFQRFVEDSAEMHKKWAHRSDSKNGISRNDNSRCDSRRNDSGRDANSVHSGGGRNVNRSGHGSTAHHEKNRAREGAEPNADLEDETNIELIKLILQQQMRNNYSLGGGERSIECRSDMLSKYVPLNVHKKDCCDKRYKEEESRENLYMGDNLGSDRRRKDKSFHSHHYHHHRDKSLEKGNGRLPNIAVSEEEKIKEICMNENDHVSNKISSRRITSKVINGKAINSSSCNATVSRNGDGDINKSKYDFRSRKRRDYNNDLSDYVHNNMVKEKREPSETKDEKRLADNSPYESIATDVIKFMLQFNEKCRIVKTKTDMNDNTNNTAISNDSYEGNYASDGCASNDYNDMLNRAILNNAIADFFKNIPRREMSHILANKGDIFSKTVNTPRNGKDDSRAQIKCGNEPSCCNMAMKELQWHCRSACNNTNSNNHINNSFSKSNSLRNDDDGSHFFSHLNMAYISLNKLCKQAFDHHLQSSSPRNDTELRSPHCNNIENIINLIKEAMRGNYDDVGSIHSGLLHSESSSSNKIKVKQDIMRRHIAPPSAATIVGGTNHEDNIDYDFKNEMLVDKAKSIMVEGGKRKSDYPSGSGDNENNIRDVNENIVSNNMINSARSNKQASNGSSNNSGLKGIHTKPREEINAKNCSNAYYSNNDTNDGSGNSETDNFNHASDVHNNSGQAFNLSEENMDLLYNYYLQACKNCMAHTKKGLHNEKSDAIVGGIEPEGYINCANCFHHAGHAKSSNMTLGHRKSNNLLSDKGSTKYDTSIHNSKAPTSKKHDPKENANYTNGGGNISAINNIDGNNIIDGNNVIDGNDEISLSFSHNYNNTKSVTDQVNSFFHNCLCNMKSMNDMALYDNLASVENENDAGKDISGSCDNRSSDRANKCDRVGSSSSHDNRGTGCVNRGNSCVDRGNSCVNRGSSRVNNSTYDQILYHIQNSLKIGSNAKGWDELLNEILKSNEEQHQRYHKGNVKGNELIELSALQNVQSNNLLKAIRWNDVFDSHTVAATCGSGGVKGLNRLNSIDLLNSLHRMNNVNCTRDSDKVEAFQKFDSDFSAVMKRYENNEIPRNYQRSIMKIVEEFSSKRNSDFHSYEVGGTGENSSGEYTEEDILKAILINMIKELSTSKGESSFPRGACTSKSARGRSGCIGNRHRGHSRHNKGHIRDGSHGIREETNRHSIHGIREETNRHSIHGIREETNRHSIHGIREENNPHRDHDRHNDHNGHNGHNEHNGHNGHNKYSRRNSHSSCSRQASSDNNGSNNECSSVFTSNCDGRKKNSSSQKKKKNTNQNNTTSANATYSYFPNSMNSNISFQTNVDAVNNIYNNLVIKNNISNSNNYYSNYCQNNFININNCGGNNYFYNNSRASKSESNALEEGQLMPDDINIRSSVPCTSNNNIDFNAPSNIIRRLQKQNISAFHMSEFQHPHSDALSVYENNSCDHSKPRDGCSIGGSALDANANDPSANDLSANDLSANDPSANDPSANDPSANYDSFSHVNANEVNSDRRRSDQFRSDMLHDYKMNMNEANADDTNMDETNIEDPNLFNANLYEENIFDANIGSTNIGDVNLDMDNLYSGNVYSGNLCGGDIYTEELYGDNLCSEDTYSGNIYSGDIYTSNNFNQTDNSDHTNNDEANDAEANYDEANYDDANYDDANYDEANYDEANYDEANYDEANYDEANCDDANYDEANYDQANYDQANYDQANCDEANYDEANYDEANCDKANCDKANCDKANCDEVNYDEVNYDEVNYDEVNYDDNNNNTTNDMQEDEETLLVQGDTILMHKEGEDEEAQKNETHSNLNEEHAKFDQFKIVQMENWENNLKGGNIYDHDDFSQMEEMGIWKNESVKDEQGNAVADTIHPSFDYSIRNVDYSEDNAHYPRENGDNYGGNGDYYSRNGDYYSANGDHYSGNGDRWNDNLDESGTKVEYQPDDHFHAPRSGEDEANPSNGLPKMMKKMECFDEFQMMNKEKYAFIFNSNVEDYYVSVSDASSYAHSGGVLDDGSDEKHNVPNGLDAELKEEKYITLRDTLLEKKRIHIFHDPIVRNLHQADETNGSLSMDIKNLTQSDLKELLFQKMWYRIAMKREEQEEKEEKKEEEKEQVEVEKKGEEEVEAEEPPQRQPMQHEERQSESRNTPATKEKDKNPMVQDLYYDDMNTNGNRNRNANTSANGSTNGCAHPEVTSRSNVYNSFSSYISLNINFFCLFDDMYDNFFKEDFEDREKMLKILNLNRNLCYNQLLMFYKKKIFFECKNEKDSNLSLDCLPAYDGSTRSLEQAKGSITNSGSKSNCNSGSNLLHGRSSEVMPYSSDQKNNTMPVDKSTSFDVPNSKDNLVPNELYNGIAHKGDVDTLIKSSMEDKEIIQNSAGQYGVSKEEYADCPLIRLKEEMFCFKKVINQLRDFQSIINNKIDQKDKNYMGEVKFEDDNLDLGGTTLLGKMEELDIDEKKRRRGSIPFDAVTINEKDYQGVVKDELKFAHGMVQKGQRMEEYYTTAAIPSEKNLVPKKVCDQTEEQNIKNDIPFKVDEECKSALKNKIIKSKEEKVKCDTKEKLEEGKRNVDAYDGYVSENSFDSDHAHELVKCVLQSGVENSYSADISSYHHCSGDYDDGSFHMETHTARGNAPIEFEINVDSSMEENDVMFKFIYHKINCIRNNMWTQSIDELQNEEMQETLRKCRKRGGRRRGTACDSDDRYTDYKVMKDEKEHCGQETILPMSKEANTHLTEINRSNANDIYYFNIYTNLWENIDLNVSHKLLESLQVKKKRINKYYNNNSYQDTKFITFTEWNLYNLIISKIYRSFDVKKFEKYQLKVYNMKKFHYELKKRGTYNFGIKIIGDSNGRTRDDVGGPCRGSRGAKGKGHKIDEEDNNKNSRKWKNSDDYSDLNYDDDDYDDDNNNNSNNDDDYYMEDGDDEYQFEGHEDYLEEDVEEEEEELMDDEEGPKEQDHNEFEAEEDDTNDFVFINAGAVNSRDTKDTKTGDNVTQQDGEKNVPMIAKNFRRSKGNSQNSRSRTFCKSKRQNGNRLCISNKDYQMYNNSADQKVPNEMSEDKITIVTSEEMVWNEKMKNAFSTGEEKQPLEEGEDTNKRNTGMSLRRKKRNSVLSGDSTENSSIKANKRKNKKLKVSAKVDIYAEKVINPGAMHVRSGRLRNAAASKGSSNGHSRNRKVQVFKKRVSRRRNFNPLVDKKSNVYHLIQLPDYASHKELIKSKNDCLPTYILQYEQLKKNECIFFNLQSHYNNFINNVYHFAVSYEQSLRHNEYLNNTLNNLKARLYIKRLCLKKNVTLRDNLFDVCNTYFNDMYTYDSVSSTYVLYKTKQLRMNKKEKTIDNQDYYSMYVNDYLENELLNKRKRSKKKCEANVLYDGDATGVKKLPLLCHQEEGYEGRVGYSEASGYPQGSGYEVGSRYDVRSAYIGINDCAERDDSEEAASYQEVFAYKAANQYELVNHYGSSFQNGNEMDDQGEMARNDHIEGGRTSHEDSMYVARNTYHMQSVQVHDKNSGDGRDGNQGNVDYMGEDYINRENFINSLNRVQRMSNGSRGHIHGAAELARGDLELCSQLKYVNYFLDNVQDDHHCNNGRCKSVMSFSERAIEQDLGDMNHEPEQENQHEHDWQREDQRDYQREYQRDYQREYQRDYQREYQHDYEEDYQHDQDEHLGGTNTFKPNQNRAFPLEELSTYSNHFDDENDKPHFNKTNGHFFNYYEQNDHNNDDHSDNNNDNNNDDNKDNDDDSDNKGNFFQEPENGKNKNYSANNKEFYFNGSVNHDDIIQYIDIQ